MLELSRALRCLSPEQGAELISAIRKNWPDGSTLHRVVQDTLEPRCVSVVYRLDSGDALTFLDLLLSEAESPVA